MKYRAFTIVLRPILTYVMVCLSGILYADGIGKFELLWKQSGPIETVIKLSDSLKMSDQEMNALVYKYRQEFNMRSGEFWASASSDTTWENYELLKKSLKTNLLFYDSLIRRFHEHKEQNSTEYLETINQWNTLLAVPPTPPVAICDNVDFENTSNFNLWSVWLGNACSYVPDLSCNSFSADNYTNANSLGRLEVVTSGFDTRATSLNRVKGSSGKSLRMENTVNGGDATKVSYTFTVNSAKPAYRYYYALVLEEPPALPYHQIEEKPYFLVTFWQGTTELSCHRFRVFADATDAKFSDKTFFLNTVPGSRIKYTGWRHNTVDLTDYIGESIRVEFVVSDCALGGHLGYAYIDGDCFKDEITIDSCMDGVRTIHTDNLFSKYYWVGDGVTENPDRHEIKVRKGGKYELIRYAENSRCYSSEYVFVSDCNQQVATPCSLTVNQVGTISCDENSNLFYVDLQVSLTGGPSGGLLKIMDATDKVEHFVNLPISSPLNFRISNLKSDGKIHNIIVSIFPDAYISDTRELCEVTLNIQAPSSCFLETMNCEDCIGGFMPTEGETYIISAWVKENLYNVSTYPDPFIQLHYTGSIPDPAPMFAEGPIIEGWQRINKEFTVPTGAQGITVELGIINGIGYFDDIRIHPLKASMKSYVYDPISLKLVAVLDENNYATFYEYNQEGTLVRTKKETEHGVVTISENRQSNPKK